MRRVLCTAVTTACLASFAIPDADAAKKTRVTVFGHDLASAGVLYNGGDCAAWSDDPIAASASSEVYALYRKPGKIGQRAIGWEFGADGGVAGSQAGALAYVPSPGSLSDLRFSAYLKDTSAAREGDLIAYLDPDDEYSDDYYVGSLTLNARSDKAWNNWTGQADKSLTWYHWLGDHWADADNNGADSFSQTIRGLARASGGSTTAFVGPELGCSGQSWYVDDLRVTTSGGTRTYDFEGVQTASILAGWRKRSDPASAIVYGLKHFVRSYGESEWIGGFTGYFEDLAGGGHKVGDVVFFAAKGTLYARSYHAHRWHRVATKSFTKSHGAAFKLAHLTRHTDYVFRYAGNTALSGSRSQVMSVDVKALIKGHVANKSVYRGGRVSVSGKRLPGDAGVKVSLQRHTRSGWHTIANSRTKHAGAFHVSAKANTLGRWKLRVSVAKAKGNLGNTTTPFTVRVKKHPAPPPPKPPVVSSPPVCTTCAGGTPDIPVGTRRVMERTALSAHAYGVPTLRRGGLPPTPQQLPLREPATVWSRRLAGM
jgi:hypothetical protein